MKKLLIIEPVIKLIPIIKLTGTLTVSPFRKRTLLLLELFCIPMIKIKNILKLNKNIKKAFLKFEIIFY